MFTRRGRIGALASALVMLLWTGPAPGQSHSGSSGGSGSHAPSTSNSDGKGQGSPSGSMPAAVGGVPYWFRYPYYSGIGPDGRPFLYVPPLVMITPGGAPPPYNPGAPPPAASGLRSGVGVAGPWPPPGLAPPNPQAAEPSRPVRTDPERAEKYLTYGDRLFRSGNLHRAAERFEQALKSDPTSATPRVRLAQVALVRGEYAEAADRYREALIADPDWLINAPDIQSLYGEPGDFHRLIGKLETHLQANPQDRDAWLVLGAQWYLSGRTRKAADVFLRLTDRKADPTLAAFLDASTPDQPEAK